MSPLFVISVITVVLLLVTGMYGLLVTRNLMRVLISLEILTKSVTLLLICAGYISGNMATAETYVITIIVIEVVLFVVATGIVLGIYRSNDTLDMHKLKR